MSKSLLTFLKGVGIGIGNIIPGVSGGTIAVILGIYAQLLESISDFISKDTLVVLLNWIKRKPDVHMVERAKLKKTFAFLCLVIFGALAGIFAFSTVLSTSLERFPEPTMFFFMGLILGSIPAIYRAYDSFAFSLSHAVAGLFGFLLMLILSFFPESETVMTVSMDTLNLGKILTLLVSGGIAAGAMIIPGISGSLMLLLLGTYGTILSAVSDFNALVLAIVAIGAVLGLITFTKSISYLLKRYPVFSAYFIMGLVIGSLVKLWPGFSYGNMGIISVIAGAIGLFAGRRLG